MFFSLNCFALSFEGKLPDEGYVKIEIDSKVLSWQMLINYIPNVRETHLHCRPSMDVGVTFRPGLSKGFTTIPDTNNKCGWKTLDDVIAAIKTDNAYVDLHTITEVSLAKADMVIKDITYIK